MPSEHLPDRETAVDMVTSVASSMGVLGIGAAFGMMWVGVQWQASPACTPDQLGPMAEASNPCPGLSGVESQAYTAVGVAVVGFVVAFGAAYYAKKHFDED